MHAFLPIIFAFFSSGFALAQKIQLHLHDRSQISSERIIVAQIATCSGTVELCKIIKSLDLGESPDPGGIRNISSSEILRLVRDEGFEQEVSNSEIAIDGSSCRVEAVGFAVNSEEIKDVVEEQVANLLPAIAMKRWTVSLSVNSKKIQLGSPTWEAKLLGIEKFQNELILSRTPFVRRAQMRITSLTGRKTTAEIWGNIRFTPEYKALSFSKFLEKGATITEDSLSESWVGFAQYMEGTPTSKTEVLGMRTKIQVKPGSLVRWNATEVIPLVTRGQEIKIKLTNGNVELDAKGKSLGQGILGSDVEVEIEGTKKRLTSKVIAMGQVEVKL